MFHRSPLVRIRMALLVFIIGLVLSGLTAFPLLAEMDGVVRFFGITPSTPHWMSADLRAWLLRVHEGLRETYERYPFMAYGTDWLAFGHLAISVFFIGPLLQPVRNRWVIVAGMWICVLVIPTALLCGAIRGIPWYWRLIDCSFGVFGILPLAYALFLVNRLENSPHPQK